MFTAITLSIHNKRAMFAVVPCTLTSDKIAGLKFFNYLNTFETTDMYKNVFI